MIENIEKVINEELNKNGFESIKISKSSRPDLCDFQCNDVFKIAKNLGTNPVEIGEKLVGIINEMPSFGDYFKSVSFLKPGFINIIVSDKFINEQIRLMNNPMFNMKKDNFTYVIDYGGPNIAKPLHVGHFRTAVIGEAIKRILRYKGNKVISDVHLGDYGLQIGEVIYAIIKDKVSDSDITLEYLQKTYPYMSGLCKEDESIKAECEEITKQMQEGNLEYNRLCDIITEVSLGDIKDLYKYLGVDFDLWESERTAYKYIPEVYKVLEDKNLLVPSQGALVVEVKEDTDTKEIPPMIFRKSNGAYLYSTTDLATIYDRENRFSPDGIIYVTDDRQKMHFTQVFRAAHKSSITDAVLEHKGYGTVNGVDGKPFKTRAGNAPSLRDLINETKDLFIAKKEENKDLSSSDIDIIVNAILKYADLSNDMEKDYIFDIDKFSSVVGKTGPYILYTYLRFNKILKEEGISNTLSSKIYNDVDRDLRMYLLNLEASFDLAYQSRKPHYIAEYLYNLCSYLNNFYQANHIKNADEAKNDWLYIINISTKVIKEMLELLGIDVPSKM